VLRSSRTPPRARDRRNGVPHRERSFVMTASAAVFKANPDVEAAYLGGSHRRIIAP